MWLLSSVIIKFSNWKPPKIELGNEVAKKSWRIAPVVLMSSGFVRLALIFVMILIQSGLSLKFSMPFCLKSENFHSWMGNESLTLSSVIVCGSTKRPGLNFPKKSLLNNQVHLRKNLMVLFYFKAATTNFWALLNNLVQIFGKSLFKRPALPFFKF